MQRKGSTPTERTVHDPALIEKDRLTIEQMGGECICVPRVVALPRVGTGSWGAAASKLVVHSPECIAKQPGLDLADDHAWTLDPDGNIVRP